MKLSEIFSTGTYVAVFPTEATAALLKDWAAEAGVVLVPDLHVTVLYSRRTTRIVTEPAEQYRATPTRLEPLGDSKLVVHLDSLSLVQRHAVFRHAGHTHDFPSYLPHMTLVGKDGTVPKDLPPMDFGLAFEGERAEPLSE